MKFKQRRRYRRYRWRSKRYTYAKRRFYKKKKTAYRRAATSTKRKFRQIKKTPIFYLPSTNYYRNYKYVRTTKTTEFTYTQAALSAAKGIIVEDFIMTHFMEKRTFDDMMGEFRDVAFLSCIVTIYISNFEQAAGIINAAPQTVAQISDTSMKPHMLAAACFNPQTQTELAGIKNDTPSVQEYWTSLPQVQRLSQRRKGCWRWQLPKSLIDTVTLTNAILASSKVGDLAPNLVGGENFLNHPHGFVAIIRDIDDYDNHLKVKLCVKIDTNFLFRIKRTTN